MLNAGAQRKAKIKKYFSSHFSAYVLIYLNFLPVSNLCFLKLVKFVGLSQNIFEIE